MMVMRPLGPQQGGDCVRSVVGWVDRNDIASPGKGEKLSSLVNC